ncbi:MAG: hypothetical protein ABI425_03550 [Patescibacteria group bacterium]
MTSSQYVIEFGNFNVTSGEKTSANYKVTDTVGQISPGEYDGSGYVVKAGFQYIYPFRTLSLKISKITIDLSELTYGSFNTDTHTLIVDTNGAGGYAVKASENHPLRLLNTSTDIRDTLCDSGSCDESTAGSWTNANNYGFGFNLSGNDVATDFASTNYFRQFADVSNAETMKTVMSGTGVSVNRNATVTYKASPQATQAAGNYETLVTYQLIATY